MKQGGGSPDPTADEINGAEGPLRVLLIGGIYGASDDRPRRETPETTLEAGLIARGVEVGTHPHSWRVGRRQWDIVHVHHLAAQALIQPLLRSGSRLVFTRHSTVQATGNRRAVLELMYRRADAVVVLAETERKTLRRRVPSNRVAVIPNGIDGDCWPFVARTPPARGQPWRLLFVGQLALFKGVDVLLRAVASLGSDVPLHLYLVFHVDLRGPELRRLAADLKIEDRVTFVGQMGRPGLREHYARAHALVLPSRTEALPSVITEAVLSGVPVIASAVGGVPEQLAGHGVLVAPGDVEQLTRSIADTFGDYAHAIRRTVPAAARARADYTVDAMVNHHLTLYREVLAQRRRDPFGVGR